MMNIRRHIPPPVLGGCHDGHQLCLVRGGANAVRLGGGATSRLRTLRLRRQCCVVVFALCLIVVILWRMSEGRLLFDFDDDDDITNARRPSSGRDCRQLPPSVIPRRVWLVWRDGNLTGTALRNHHAWKAREPCWPRQVITDTQCRDLAIRAGMGHLYDNYPLHVMRADACRIFAVFFFGGMYMDLDVAPSKPLSQWWNDSANIMLGWEFDWQDVSNWIFAAEPRHPCLGGIIEAMKRRGERVLLRWPRHRLLHNVHFVHDLTGPWMFTDGILGCRASRDGTPPPIGWSRGDISNGLVWHQYGSNAWRRADNKRKKVDVGAVIIEQEHEAAATSQLRDSDASMAKASTPKANYPSWVVLRDMLLASEIRQVHSVSAVLYGRMSDAAVNKLYQRASSWTSSSSSSSVSQRAGLHLRVMLLTPSFESPASLSQSHTGGGFPLTTGQRWRLAPCHLRAPFDRDMTTSVFIPGRSLLRFSVATNHSSLSVVGGVPLAQLRCVRLHWPPTGYLGDDRIADDVSVTLRDAHDNVIERVSTTYAVASAFHTIVFWGDDYGLTHVVDPRRRRRPQQNISSAKVIIHHDDGPLHGHPNASALLSPQDSASSSSSGRPPPAIDEAIVVTTIDVEKRACSHRSVDDPPRCEPMGLHLAEIVLFEDAACSRPWSIDAVVNEALNAPMMALSDPGQRDLHGAEAARHGDGVAIGGHYLSLHDGGGGRAPALSRHIEAKGMTNAGRGARQRGPSYQDDAPCGGRRNDDVSRRDSRSPAGGAAAGTRVDGDASTRRRKGLGQVVDSAAMWKGAGGLRPQPNV